MFGFYFKHENHNRTTDLKPDREVLAGQWKAKMEVVKHLKPGDQVQQYENCVPPPALYSWGKSTGVGGMDLVLMLLGAIWSRTLPFIEFLVFISVCTPVRFQNQCLSDAPVERPVCTFPSGRAVNASAYWPTKKYSRLHGHPVQITTVRFFCPVPTGEELDPDTFTVTLTQPTYDHTVPVALCRKSRVFGLLVACPQPLFNYGKLNTLYPNMVHEWLAYHRMIGFHKFMIYDLFGDFMKPLQPWVDIGFVEHITRLAPMHLLPPTGNTSAMAGREYCLEGASHDHCLFMHQLTAGWGMLLHAPDNYLTFRTPKYPDYVTSLLKDKDPTTTAEWLVMTLPCGGPLRAKHAPLTLSFVHCRPALYRRRETPILSTLLVLTTAVHRSGTIHPSCHTKEGRCLEIFRPTDLATIHYMQMLWRKDWAGKYKKNTTNLVQLWRKFHTLMKEVVPETSLTPVPAPNPLEWPV